MTKEQLNIENKTLSTCPFCRGKAEFYVCKNDKAPLCIRHIPASGVICPAIWDQYCETFENGKNWWNKRSE